MTNKYAALLDRLLSGNDLSESESSDLMRDLASGDIDPAAAGALLAGLR